jgi:hypothetical protein
MSITDQPVFRRNLVGVLSYHPLMSLCIERRRREQSGARSTVIVNALLWTPAF